MTNSKPLVTICCLVYNQENYIRQAFDGFLKQQTNFDFEIIVHDDASNDNSKSIIENYTSKDDRFKPIFQENNKYSKGERIWFKYMFPKCKGKYIAICDGDDYWTDPLKLQKQVDFLENNLDYGIVGAKLKSLDQNTNTISEWTHEKNKIPNLNIKNLIEGNFIFSSSSLFVNDFNVEPWWQNLPIGDWPMYILQIKSRKIKILDEFMGVYRVHSNGIFSKISISQQLNTELKCLEILYQYGEFSKDIKILITKNIHDKKTAILLEQQKDNLLQLRLENEKQIFEKSQIIEEKSQIIEEKSQIIDNNIKELEYLYKKLNRIKKSIFYKTFVKIELFLRNIKKIKKTF